MKLHAIYEPDEGAPVVFVRIEGTGANWFAGVSIGLGNRYEGRGKTMEQAVASLVRALEKTSPRRKPKPKPSSRKKKR